MNFRGRHEEVSTTNLTSYNYTNKSPNPAVKLYNACINYAETFTTFVTLALNNGFVNGQTDRVISCVDFSYLLMPRNIVKRISFVIR